MADAYLALFHHDLDVASDEARAGAILVAEHHCLLNALVKGVAGMGGPDKSPGRPRSKIRR
ncbi:MAG: hypothetical protein JWM10_3702 [Myxococcaceae bacterium]|nr:hypothetical protein [Myxococcaceae bacterium]